MKILARYSALIILFTSALLNESQAQDKKFYFQLNTGYGLGMGFYTGEIVKTKGSTLTEHELYKVKYGQGFVIGSSIGYNCSKLIGFELAVNYLLGKTAEFGELNTSGVNVNFYQKARMLQFNPNLVINNHFEKLTLYTKIGPIIGKGHLHNIIEQSNSNNSQVKETILYKGGLAFGLNASLGIVTNPLGSLSFFSELNLCNLNYAPSRAETTLIEINGVDRTSEYSSDERTTLFSDNYTSSNSDSQNPSGPRQALKYSYSLSSFGLRLGLRYKF